MLGHCGLELRLLVEQCSPQTGEPARGASREAGEPGPTERANRGTPPG